VIRYRAPLDRFPVFGREGYALPLGPVVQHTGEIDETKPLDGLWIFGKPAQPLDGFTQARIDLRGDKCVISVANDVKVEIFGDAAGTDVQPSN